jgi:hypothetical protein
MIWLCPQARAVDALSLQRIDSDFRCLERAAKNMHLRSEKSSIVRILI